MKPNSKSERIEKYGRTYSPESFEKFKKYQRKFMKDTYQKVEIRFRKREDAEILKHLYSQESIAGYIKELIVRDMNNL